MKHALLPLFAALALAMPAFAAEVHAPKYGGVVLEAKAGDLQLVAKPDLIVSWSARSQPTSSAPTAS